MFAILFLGISLYLLVLLLKNKKVLRAQHNLFEKAQSKMEQLTVERDRLIKEVESLFPYKDVRDVALEIARIKNEAEANFLTITHQAAEVLASATADAQEKKNQSNNILRIAIEQAERIVQQADENAEKIAGDAYLAYKQSETLAATIKAMKNVIDGYGEQYIKPTFSLLDELAEHYIFTDAGAQLKQSRERTKLMIAIGRAATCDYVEKNRADTAIRFVTDAFNGKVDSILSRAKTENYGILEQQIKDAFALTNRNGQAFRNAVITKEYCAARIEELHWLVATNVIREQEREEQRRIREQIREEERARRDYERARKEAEKEEAVIQKAIEKMHILLAKATGEQRIHYETKLAHLNEKLLDAEAKNQRAISMAQQTRTGHVYVISNIGSFGEDVFKVGMTRRLEPLDRIKELGDASVPFSFDVHAMIWSEDAPALEKTLHRTFLTQQLNKVNPKKEFFRVSLTDIKAVIESLALETVWTMTARAAEYRESLQIEKRLANNTQIHEAWLKHQLEFEPELETETVEI